MPPASRRPRLSSRERLRRRHRPRRVRVLVVAEAPPASGRFFYQEDSGLYRALRRAFARFLTPGRPFLDSFRDEGWYLVDLCPRPVDRLSPRARERPRRDGEAALARTLRALRPEAVVVVLLAIGPHVRRAVAAARWDGLYAELPYPGQWKRNRDEFARQFRDLMAAWPAIGRGR